MSNSQMMCLVKNLTKKNFKKRKTLVKEKSTHQLIRIQAASLKTLQGKSSGTKPCEEKRVHRVLTPPNDNINTETKIFVFQAWAPYF